MPTVTSVEVWVAGYVCIPIRCVARGGSRYVGISWALKRWCYYTYRSQNTRIRPPTSAHRPSCFAMQRVVHHIDALRHGDSRASDEMHAHRLNARFREGRASDDVREVGIIFKQFDGQETDPTRPWEACAGVACKCQGGETCPGRTSAMIASKRLGDRADRRAVPLPFVDRAGIGRRLALSTHGVHGMMLT